MPDITNPQAVRFCNEQARTLADAAAAYYWKAKSVLAEWNSTGMSSLLPNTSDPVIDGSATDGRTVITGANVNGLINHVQAMVADLEANSNAKLNILMRIEVNGSP